MYTNNAASFLNGKMGNLSGGKLKYAAYGSGKRPFQGEATQPTSSGYLDMFRGGVRGLGVLPDEYDWTSINCENAKEWFFATGNAFRFSAFIEWAWQMWWKANNSGQSVNFQTAGGTTAASSAACICKDMYVLVNHDRAGFPAQDSVYVAYIPCGSKPNNNSTVSQLMGIKKWNMGGVSELPQNADWWADGDGNLITSHYVNNGNKNVSYANWMTSVASKCPPCGNNGGGTSCPAPCVLDDNGNCMKACNGKVIRCSDPCEPEKPPTPGTDCCETCEATSKQGTTQFYLSKNKTAKSIPVMVRGKTIECTPKNPDKQYKWDCDQVMKQIESYLGNRPNTNTASGIGHLGFGVIGSGYAGAGKVTAGQIASGTTNTPCPCDCKEIDGQVQMYVNTNKTGEGDIPFTLPYTTVDCKGKGGFNPDGSPKGDVTNMKINCDDIKNAIAQQGYSMSGMGDCGCGNCNGQNGMGDLSGGQIAAYALGAGLLSLALFYVFGNKIKEL